MATKSKAAEVKPYSFFIFLFSSLISSGLLSSLNKHKNDCHNVFFINSLLFPINSNGFFLIHRIYRRWRTKCRYQASEQGELTIPCLKNASKKSVTFVFPTSSSSNHRHFLVAVFFLFP